MALSHYLNQYWLIISKVLWLSFQGNFTRDASIINHWNLFENYMSKISFIFPRGQWVNLFHLACCQQPWGQSGGKLGSSQSAQCTVIYLISDTLNPQTSMIIVLFCSCLCPIHWSQVLSQEWRLEMPLEQRWEVMLQLHLSDQQVYCLPRCGLY